MPVVAVVARVAVALALDFGLAHTIATGSPHAVNAPFTLDRFVTGRLIDEHGAAAVAH
mgnify:CR=1 FL=1